MGQNLLSKKTKIDLIKIIEIQNKAIAENHKIINHNNKVFDQFLIQHIVLSELRDWYRSKLR